MKKQSILLAIVFLLAACGRVAAYSGGTGEPNDPYLIATAEDMNEIGANPDDWDAYFLLTADINLADYTGTQFNIIGYFEKWDSPNNVSFTGIFDGDKHTISNFTYTTTDTDYIGIFGYIDGTKAEIKDLNLVDPDVNAAGDSDSVGSLVGHLEAGTVIGCAINSGNTVGQNYVGGLVGYNHRGTISDCNANGKVSGNWVFGGLVGYNFNTILNCNASGSVSGHQNMGGLVGCNYGHISNCYAIGGVSGDDYTGGLVGKNYSTVSNCYAAGDISGHYAGGLVGENYYGQTSNCYATGNVSGTIYTGGLVGWNWKSTIENCYATGSVSGDSYTGGLVGWNGNSTISNCYATGAVGGNDYTGGLVGRNGNSTIENCYATGSVSGDSYTGGLVGYNSLSTITASFWDIETSGQSSSAGGNPKTTAEMKRQFTFTNVNWDFIEVWNTGENQTYPFLRVYPAGDIDHDNIVNFVDVAILAGHWLEETGQ